MTDANDYEAFLLRRIWYTQAKADELRDHYGPAPFALALAITDNVANLDEMDESLDAVCLDIYRVVTDLKALGYVITAK